MKKNLTIKQILDIHAVISNIHKTEIKIKIKESLDLALNKKVLEPVVESINELRKPSEKISEYLKKRNDIQIEEATKDENNNPVILGNSYIFKNVNRVNEKIEILNNEYKEELDKYTKIEKEIEETLKSVKEVELNEISLETFSGESSDAINLIEILLPIIKINK